jgi:hypothetical protein
VKGLLIIILVLSIVLVYYSGGVAIKDGKLSLDYQTMVERLSTTYHNTAGELSKAVQGISGNISLSKPPPDYELQVTEVKYLKDCIQVSIDKRDSCILVNLEMRNNHSERIDFEMMGKAIVTKDGRQLERYGGLYNTKELNGLCDTDVYYKVFPGARTVTGMCFPMVGKGDEPVLYIKMSANGKWKEHNFDLTPYIS